MNDGKTSLSRRRRWLLLALLGALVLLLVLAAYWPRALVVEVASVSRGDFERSIEEDGSLRPQQRYLITAPSAAQLQRPVLRVGDPVRRGDVVARLTPLAAPLLDARTRLMLQQRVGSADAARRAAAAQVQRLQAALAQASADAERAQRLAQGHFIAAAALEQARLAQQAAQQALAAAQAEQAMAEHALAEARAALRGDDTAAAAPPAPGWTLRSPVDGQVIKLHLQSAAVVAAAQPLLELADLRALEAVIEVLSQEVGQIQVGAPVRLSFGRTAADVPGRVLRIEPVAVTRVSALGIAEQRVNVIVGLDAAAPTSASLGDGFRVDARITVAAQPGVLLVPTAALQRGAAQWQVLLLEQGRARARVVQVQDRNAEQAWIAADLEPGQAVLLFPGDIQDGQRVRTRAPAR